MGKMIVNRLQPIICGRFIILFPGQNNLRSQFVSMRVSLDFLFHSFPRLIRRNTTEDPGIELDDLSDIHRSSTDNQIMNSKTSTCQPTVRELSNRNVSLQFLR